MLGGIVKGIGSFVSGVGMVLKGKRIVEEVADLGPAVVDLKKEAEEVLEKYKGISSEMGEDLRRILRAADNVTEHAADVAREVGLDNVERNLRNWIKKEYYS